MTGSRESTLRIAISDAAPPTGAGSVPAPTRGTAPDRGAPAADDHATDRPVLMTVRGNLDIDSAARLRESLAGLLDASAYRIIVDLAGLDFCDSIGLSALTDAHRACLRRGGYFRIAAPSAFLLRVLEVVGLIGRLAVYDSVTAALADDPPGGRPAPPVYRPAR